MLVYDITDEDSFDKVQTWVEELRLYLPEDTPIAIAGNKCDMKNRTVDKDLAEDYARDIKGAHFDTSAKTGKGIDDVFYQLAKAIIRKNKRENKKKKSKKSVKTGKRKGGFGVKQDDEMALG